MISSTSDVHFGVSLSNRAVVIGKVRAIEMVEVARAAEDSGLFDSAWVGDSIIAIQGSDALVQRLGAKKAPAPAPAKGARAGRPAVPRPRGRRGGGA